MDTPSVTIRHWGEWVPEERRRPPGTVEGGSAPPGPAGADKDRRMAVSVTEMTERLRRRRHVGAGELGISAISSMKSGINQKTPTSRAKNQQGLLAPRSTTD